MTASSRYQSQDDGGISTDQETVIVPLPNLTPQPNPDHSQDMRFPSPAALPRVDYDLTTGPERIAKRIDADEARLERDEARLERDEARLQDAETRIEQLEAAVDDLRLRLRVQERVLLQTHERALTEMRAFAIRVRSLEAAAAPVLGDDASAEE